MLDKIMGCMMGGAIGDALGYPIEFMQESRLNEYFGKTGITEYMIDSETGTALISDDTQMMLFTANGILYRDTLEARTTKPQELYQCVRMAYKEWLVTQKFTYNQWLHANDKMWLMDDKRLYSRRAPGNTCLTALVEGGEYSIQNPANASKGSGGVMRVAPLALRYTSKERSSLDYEGAQLAALTHGHALGYMPAAVLIHIINSIVYPTDETMSLKEIIREGLAVMAELFEGDVHVAVMEEMVERAIALAENDKDDRVNIHSIGEGWVAEETLAIAIYCSLRYQDDFTKGIIASVNHNGDSDSTGCVTGNILGALLGYDVIEERWKEKLELSDVIMEISKDLANKESIKNFIDQDTEWKRKYNR